jgi:polygalacturonase
MTSKTAIYAAVTTILVWILPMTLHAQGPYSTESKYNVMAFGAKGDGIAKDTKAIQEAIDACHKSGGGTVYFPPGTYLTGSLRLRSNIALYLDHGATIMASKDDNDFDPYETLAFENDADHETSYFHHAHLWGEDVERVAVIGTGVIDGNRTKRGGPKSIALKRCKYVTIKDITILNAPNYAISMLGTDHVNIDGVSILNGYCDGIDPDACHHVRISNCHIESWDDAIVPKTSFSLGRRRSTENLTVTNCILATNCNAFKLGTESGGDFKYITISNCVMFKRPNMKPPSSGISLLSVDGANIDGVTITNISMIDVSVPIFLRLGNRGRDMETPVPGTLKNVIISNVVATGADSTCSIAGIPGHPIEGVTLNNIRITYKSTGSLEQTEIEVPEHIAKYPSAHMFGDLPAFGFYCRHVSGLKLDNVDLSCAAPDMRHAVLCDDVANLEIESLRAQYVSGAGSPLRFDHVVDAWVRGCRPSAGTNGFLSVSGYKSSGIALTGNDFRRIERISVLGEDVSKDAVVEQFNLKSD